MNELPVIRRSTYSRRNRHKQQSPRLINFLAKLAMIIIGGLAGLFLGAIIAGVILGKSPEDVTKEVLQSIGVTQWRSSPRSQSKISLSPPGKR